jgi:hypothetical protein
MVLQLGFRYSLPQIYDPRRYPAKNLMAIIAYFVGIHLDKLKTSTGLLMRLKISKYWLRIYDKNEFGCPLSIEIQQKSDIMAVSK